MAEKQEPTFEEAMNRIQEIVRAMESGSASLDHELELYEEGTRLIQFCTEKLNQAELKIQTLQKKQ